MHIGDDAKNAPVLENVTSGSWISDGVTTDHDGKFVGLVDGVGDG